MIGMTDENGMTIYTVSSSGVRSAGLEGGYAQLVAAIIKQAVLDYDEVLQALFARPSGFRRVELETEKADLENFFHSAWYDSLTELDGEKLMQMTKSRAVERAKNKIRKEHEKKLKSMRH